MEDLLRTLVFKKKLGVDWCSLLFSGKTVGIERWTLQANVTILAWGPFYEK